MRGLARMKIGHYALADQDFRSALGIEPDNHEFINSLASAKQCLENQGKYCHDHLAKIKEQADALFGIRDCKKALEMYRSGIQQCGKQIKLHNNLVYDWQSMMIVTETYRITGGAQLAQFYYGKACCYFEVLT